ncbi:MAG: hypothetical protein ABIG39_06150 [Candidatus Micrarchaeota archaeon]
MDIDKIKTGRLKPKFVVALEWLTLSTVTLALFSLLYAYFSNTEPLIFQVATFILLIEVGILSILYGAEGIRYKIIWLTYPAPSGQKRIGFGSTASIFVGLCYIIMGLALILFAILFAYLNTVPADFYY